MVSLINEYLFIYLLLYKVVKASQGFICKTVLLLQLH